MENKRTMFRNSPHGILAFAALLILSLPGCGSGKYPVVPVQGKLTYQGKPAPFVDVQFHPTDESMKEKKILPAGTTRKDGTFTLTTYETDDGAPAGEYKVTLYWATLAPGQILDPSDPESRPEGPDGFQGRFANPETTTLSATVSEGRGNVTVNVQ
jgi:hypothetical protein